MRKRREPNRPSHERRLESRVNEEDKVTVEVVSDLGGASEEQAVNALTRDISAGGVKIMTNVRLPDETPLRLAIALSGRRKLIRAEGIVRWSKSVYEEDLYEMGVEFTKLSPEDRVTLLEHVYNRHR
jgi:uncharacterized protein (TIGR02266 family)